MLPTVEPALPGQIRFLFCLFERNQHSRKKKKQTHTHTMLPWLGPTGPATVELLVFLRPAVILTLATFLDDFQTVTIILLLLLCVLFLSPI